MTRKMISLTISLLLLCCISLGVCAQAEEIAIYDEVNLLNQNDELALNETLLDIGQRYGTQLVILAMNSQGTDIDQAADALFDGMEFGYGDDRSCVMLLIFMDTRKVCVFSNNSLEEAARNDVRTAITPYLSSGEYVEAFEAFADKCEYYLEGQKNGFSFAFGKNLLICLVIGVIVGTIVALILKGQLKSVRQQNKADVYVKPGSMQLTTANDFFLYRTVTRTKKASSNSSGGGSSRGSSSGSF